MPNTFFLKFTCDYCDFKTNNKKDFNRHNMTAKHINRCKILSMANENTHTPSIVYKCKNCDKIYKHQSSLCKHNKICKDVSQPTSSINQIINTEMFMEIVKQSKEIQNVLVEQNKELQQKLLEQGQKLLEKEEQLIEQQKQLIEMAKKPSMVNSNNNNNINNNNHFNLSFFLNETCKNAMNIQDFISSIKLTTQDFETTGKIGFVDGISRIFINELKRIEVERRPLHCTDVKRETVYVKDNDIWEKENQEKKKLKWAINSIAQLNLNQVQQWQQEYPECRENNTVANTEFNKMAMVALGGFGDEQEKKFNDKIVKNVLKEIVVGRET